MDKEAASKIFYILNVIGDTDLEKYIITCSETTICSENLICGGLKIK